MNTLRQLPYNPVHGLTLFLGGGAYRLQTISSPSERILCTANTFPVQAIAKFWLLLVSVKCIVITIMDIIHIASYVYAM